MGTVRGHTGGAQRRRGTGIAQGRRGQAQQARHRADRAGTAPGTRCVHAKRERERDREREREREGGGERERERDRGRERKREGDPHSAMPCDA
jgi:hypothetical protein